MAAGDGAPLPFKAQIVELPPAVDAYGAIQNIAAARAPEGFAATLMANVASAAPFLARASEREADWLDTVWERPVEQSFAALLDETRTAAKTQSETEAMRLLRVARRRAALLIALADVGAIWDLDQTTAALTAFADAALSSVIDRLLVEEAVSGKLPSLDPTRSGLFALAMGKMGARELNYSSDIDLILLFDPDRLSAADQMTAKERFPKLARKLVKLLSEITPDGYVARVDLRLRPDPSATLAALSTEAAEHYYESMGRTWERAAHIKARVCAGDHEAGAAYLERLSPFIWRRHLDFATIEETSDILAKIREVEGGREVAVRGQDLKLGAGGIREIEFFAQTQQLMLGGRDPSLRAPRTRDALRALVSVERISEQTRLELDDAYVHLRRFEHAIQMLEDRQTHRAPADPEGCARVAALMRYDEFEPLRLETRRHMSNVRTASALLDPRPAADGSESELNKTLETLPDPAAARRIVESWASGKYRALRTESARGKLERMAPELLRRMAQAIDPMGALIRFDRLLEGLPAGVQLMSLFEETPALLDLITEITAVAPRLSDVLSRHSAVFDAVLDPGFFELPPGVAELSAELAETLEPIDDYERALDAVRRWSAERRFQTGVGLLRGTTAPTEAAAAYSDIAAACLERLFPWVQSELERRFGAPPGRGAAVLAMGNLGSREMTATSDVDLIVLYDAEMSDMSGGPKETPAPQYYSKLTQTLTAALSAPTAEGALYEVDMRLRPSGNAGPLATSREAFRRYQQDNAWLWEHMALTRARPVAGSEAARDAARGAVAEALGRARQREATLKAAAEMRARVDEAHGADRDRLWALKISHGALIDAEFVAQAGLLATDAAGEGGLSTQEALARLTENAFLPAAEALRLAEAHGFVFAMHQICRVALEPPFDFDGAGPGVRHVLQRAAGVESFDQVEDRLRAAKTTIRKIFKQTFSSA